MERTDSSPSPPSPPVSYEFESLEFGVALSSSSDVAEGEREIRCYVSDRSKGVISVDFAYLPKTASDCNAQCQSACPQFLCCDFNLLAHRRRVVLLVLYSCVSVSV